MVNRPGFNPGAVHRSNAAGQATAVLAITRQKPWFAFGLGSQDCQRRSPLQQDHDVPIRARHRRRLRAPAIAVLGAVAAGVLLVACSAANPPPAAPPGTTRPAPSRAPTTTASARGAELGVFEVSCHTGKGVTASGRPSSRETVSVDPPDGALGDAAGDRQGRPSGGRRHRRGHQGSAAGYLGAIGGRLHAVRSQAAAGLASSLAGPSLVRGTRRNSGQPRIITNTDPAVHGRSCQLDRPSSCPLQRRGHRFEPCHATNRAEPGWRWRRRAADLRGGHRTREPMRHAQEDLGRMAARSRKGFEKVPVGS
jgi:hypothetical protein